MSKTLELLQTTLKPGDVINTVPKWTWNPLGLIVQWAIQRWQRKFFGARAYWKSTHAMIYLGPEVFEVTTPRSRFVPLEQLAKKPELRILRYQQRELTMEDLTVMRKAAEQIAGESYDYLDLLDFMLFELLGFPKDGTEVFTGVLGLGRKRLVCSTGIASLFRKLRQVLEKQGVALPKLFGGTPVELTSPAHFDNHPTEFKLVGWIKRGRNRMT